MQGWSKQWLDTRYAGPSLLLVGFFLFTASDALTTSCLRQGATPGQVVFIRNAITVPPLYLYLHTAHPDSLRWIKIREGRMAGLIWLRAALLSFSICCIYAALDHIALSEFMSVYCVRTFSTAFICWLVLGEAFGWRLSLAAISFLAVLIITQPSFLFKASEAVDTGGRMKGFCLTGLAILSETVEVLIVRSIGLAPSPFACTLAYACLAIPISPIYMFIQSELFGSLLDPLFWVKIVALSLTGFTAQTLLVAGTQRVNGGVVSLLGYSQVPMGLVMQIAIFGDMPNALCVLGMVVIITAGLSTILYAPRATEHGDSVEDMHESAGRDDEALIPLVRTNLT